MSLNLDKAQEIYNSICRVRAFEDRLTLVHKQGHVAGGVFTGKGHEVLTAVAASFLGKEDILGPTHRDMAAHFAKGITYLDMARQWLARATGGTFGKDNAAHLGSQEINVFGIISHLGSMLPLVAGATMVNRIRGDNRVGLTFIGDGATSCADFHEGLAFMASQKLPVVVVIENNGYAYSTPVVEQTRRENFADHGKAFDIPFEVVDGTDIEITYKAFEKAYRHVHDGHGPYIVEGKVWRMSGHSLADDCSYVPDSFKEEGEANDPVFKTQKYLLAQGVSQTDLDEVLGRWVEEAHVVFERVLQEAHPAPETVTEGVFAEAMTL